MRRRVVEHLEVASDRFEQRLVDSLEVGLERRKNRKGVAAGHTEQDTEVSSRG